MCGIYGFIGKTEKMEEALDLFKILATKTEVRGTDATGFYAVDDVDITKDKAPEKASDFWKARNINDLVGTPQILVGHNRKATVGDPSDNENNHPFYNENFGFVHNGDVAGDTNHVEVEVGSECDSERLFQYIVAREPHYRNTENAIKDAIITFDRGAMACAMVDNENSLLHLFRNAGRPLVYMFDGYLNLVVFASNRTILEEAYTEVGMAFSRSRIKSVLAGQVVTLNTDVGLNVSIANDENGQIIFDEVTGVPIIIETVSGMHKSMVYDLRAPFMGIKNWKKYHEEFGYEEDDFGKKFELNGTQYMLWGFNYREGVEKPITVKEVESNKTVFFTKEELANVEYIVEEETDEEEQT